ncbi:MAG TPA: alpha/beta hydrolase [Solirubrobacteraceae bacterium]|jgi:pimeloyl-ACP methyl ester carboxylesterase
MSVAINYRREGDGPALLLLHGVGHHWQAWKPVMALLREDFDVIACDSPGFGDSAPLPEGIEPTITSYADAFEWFIAELGLQRPQVAGNSMGGAIGLELARRHSIGSVTAFSPAGFWTAAERRYCQLSLSALASLPAPARPAVEAAARTRAGRTALFSQTFGYPARLPGEAAVATLRNAWASPAFGPALAAFDCYRFERPEQLRNVPITIAWGRRDRLLPYRLQAPRARRLLPDATHLVLGAGHVPFYDDPAASAEAIRMTAAAHDLVTA